MEREQLRAIQTPLKERYEKEPESAVVTLEADGSLAEGDLDFRGTLAVDREAPVGFMAIRLSFELETEADEEELATLLKLTERYCVVFQTLAKPPELSATLGAKR